VLEAAVAEKLGGDLCGRDKQRYGGNDNPAPVTTTVASYLAALRALGEMTAAFVVAVEDAMFR
jgi:hypothetical protein